MNKNDLLKSIAISGYNVGFGTKKTYATYDIVQKVPGWIGLLSIIVSVVGLYREELSSKDVSAFFIFLSVAGLYINFYDNEKEKYDKIGKKQTEIYDSLRDLYHEVNGDEKPDAKKYLERRSALMRDFSSVSVSKQIFGSNWYAHYKFFYEMETGWIEEQRPFSWKDKVPKSFLLFIAAVIILMFFYLC
ncbi:SLATT domain-containing protein [Pantoea vagans]|uniref:SLATT domain-containing protein n=1 Tax=Pantoea vagans TaxID=470934 RepID=UPI0028A1C214|nr:SLATT domain-containing protein [Pantoea vagans]